MTFKVFLVSNIEDRQLANDLTEALERYQIKVVSHSEITPFQSYRLQVDNLIRTSDCVLVFIGQRGRQTDDMNYEIERAIKSNRIIIPLVEKGSDVPRAIRKMKYIEVNRRQPQTSYERAAKYLEGLKIEKERRDALGGLLLLGLGILLLAALASGD